MGAESVSTAAGPAPLSWSHCIATLNRIDVLERAIRLSLAQTRPPCEIIVVDASVDHALHRSRIEALFAATPRPRLHYVAATARSATRQRNQAIDIATGDVLLLFDDDTLMFPDCAAALMAVYDADVGARIAAAAATHVPDLPDADHGNIPRKATGGTMLGSTAHPALRAVRAWIWSEVFLMNAARHFIPYDTPRHRGSTAEVAALGVPGIHRQPVLAGYAMSVRRDVAQRERFDDALLSYSPAEDLDASYRFSRHGLNVSVAGARVHHFEAASGRIKRRQATTLGLMNTAAFVARKSTNHSRDVTSYYVMFARRLAAEFWKDLLSGRLSFPQLTGAAAALWPTIRILRYKGTDFTRWYEDRQLDVLGSAGRVGGPGEWRLANTGAVPDSNTGDASTIPTDQMDRHAPAEVNR